MPLLYFLLHTIIYCILVAFIIIYIYECDLSKKLRKDSRQWLHTINLKIHKQIRYSFDCHLHTCATCLTSQKQIRGTVCLYCLCIYLVLGDCVHTGLRIIFSLLGWLSTNIVYILVRGQLPFYIQCLRNCLLLPLKSGTTPQSSTE